MWSGDRRPTGPTGIDDWWPSAYDSVPGGLGQCVWMRRSLEWWRRYALGLIKHGGQCFNGRPRDVKCSAESGSRLGDGVINQRMLQNVAVQMVCRRTTRTALLFVSDHTGYTHWTWEWASTRHSFRPARLQRTTNMLRASSLSCPMRGAASLVARHTSSQLSVPQNFEIG